ncbi:hypothetical protein K2173_003948 [Erythroxylum novogranatense]|uniref:Light-regulated protein n=1 Tax=Erythroxylum novogranatense TaxID=1862640 RepID=A0AAV8SJ88_9ROSI|nr:hypothetical protein K2173_003948 [Erythroxylum novogranatense]
MQAALRITPTVLPIYPSKAISITPPKLPGSVTSRCSAIKAASVAYETSTVDYSSTLSVFPAEACEVVGGDACQADIYPEVRLNPDARNEASRVAAESFDRDYLEYNGPKTVFCAEACDDLGGEFCAREYQRGVY